MKRSAVWMALIAVGYVVASVLATQSVSPDTLIEEADALFDRWTGTFDFDAYEERLRGAIGRYEEALLVLDAADVARSAHVRNRLAQAYFELATAYLVSDREKEAAFLAGRDHALASLRLDPAFRTAEAASFRDALASADDVAAVFWYGNDAGSYMNYHQLEAMFGGGARDVPTCYERAVALDETYLGGAPLRSLACYLARVPGFLGGDLARARELFDRAMVLAPDFLENPVNLAELVLKPSGDVAEACTFLQDVVARSADPEVMGAWPFYNELSTRQARKLLASLPCP
ncbi:MAG: TRAP transporter TatT component family protein [Candidatus Bipolaricaulia bacterium]